MSLINRENLERLAELARLELSKEEEDKLLKDFEKILDHFGELNEVDTEGVLPMTGGTFEKDVFREEALNLPKEKAVDSFPKTKKGFLKIPQVFEN